MPERRTVAALSVVAAVVAIAVIVSAAGPDASRGAGQAAPPSGAVAVQRRDLVATDTESGTLGYANPETVYNRLSGTITSLPTLGQVIRPGGVLYRVDGNPVVLMNGTVPAYRTLSAGVSAGADVEQLKRNLIALGFAAADDLTINNDFDAATTEAVDRWQASLGETETGAVSLGQVVFLPGAQRITGVDGTLGSSGGSSGSGSGQSGAASSASYTPVTPARPEFVDLTASAAARPEFVDLSSSTTTTSTSTTSSTSTAPPKPRRPGGKAPSGKQVAPSGSASETAILLALLRAEVAELKHDLASARTGAATGAGTTAASASSRSSRSRAPSTSSTATSSAGSAGASAGSGGASAQAILQTSSDQLVVTVDLDATKQSEAVKGAPVSVQMPNGSTVNGRITAVSPVAENTSSGSSSSSGGGSGSSGSGSSGGSSGSSATIPVTIAVLGRHSESGLDQAAVSVSFEQQIERGVLSVPVTALLATAGGGYAVQTATAPHRLIAVTPGLFAAGYVQVSGSALYPGLEVTDSQG